jgi:hypothetical protein
MKTTQNPLLFEKHDPAFPLEDITSPTIKVTKNKHKRDIRDLRRKETAAEAIKGLDYETEIYGFTKGQFSVIDIIEAVLEHIGHANLTVSTWTASTADVTSVVEFVQNKRCSQSRWLVDYTFQQRSPELAKRIRDVFGADSIRVGKNHSKFFMLRNAEWDIICMTSMNLNFNPRFENFMIRNDPDMCDFHQAIFDEIWKTQPANMASQKAGIIERHFKESM